MLSLYRILCLCGALFIIQTTLFGQRPDLFWVGGFEEYPSVQGYANYRIRFGNFGNTVIDTTDWNIPFESTSAAVSDSSGTLVLMSNGCAIYDGEGQVIQGGEHINPGPVHDLVCENIGYIAPKGALFLPLPGSNRDYILLHSGIAYDALQGFSIGPFYYSKIHIEAGASVVEDANSVLLSGEIEMFSVVRHGNGRDWWIVVPKPESGQYYIFLLSPQGISGPAFFTTGVIQGAHVGASAFSPDGSKFAYFNPDQGAVVLDFDRCAGFLSQPRFVPVPFPLISGGGIAFTPSGNKILVTSQSTLYESRFDAQPAQFDTVFHLFDNYKWGTTLHEMQYDADQRLFVSSHSRTQYINQITFDTPEKVDTLVFKSIKLPVYTARSLPNFPNFRLYDLPGSVCDTLGVNGPTVQIETIGPKNTDFQIYPNPAADRCLLKYQGCNAAMLEIETITGVVLQRHRLNGSDGELWLDVSALLPGLYVATITTAGGQISARRFSKM